MSSFFLRFGAFNGLILVLCVLMYNHTVTFPLKWFYEQGPIEVASTSILLLAAVMMFLHPFAIRRVKMALGWLLTIMTLRELDMDQVLTSDSVFKAKFYTSAAPVHEKILGVLMIIGTLWVLWQCIRLLPALFRKIMKGDHTAWLVGTGIAYVVLGRFLDTMDRTAHWVKENVLTDSVVNMQMEESFEYLGYMMMLIAVIHSYRVMTDEALRKARQSQAKTSKKKSARR